MKLVPYINFTGQAEEAIHLYAQALGGSISDIMRFNKNSHHYLEMTRNQPEMSLEELLQKHQNYFLLHSISD